MPVIHVIASYTCYSTSRCTTSADADWLSDTYDDTDWQAAELIHQNTASVPIWGHLDGIASTANPGYGPQDGAALILLSTVGTEYRGVK